MDPSLASIQFQDHKQHTPYEEDIARTSLKLQFVQNVFEFIGGLDAISCRIPSPSFVGYPNTLRT